jgi:hypothetical protein
MWKLIVGVTLTRSLLLCTVLLALPTIVYAGQCGMWLHPHLDYTVPIFVEHAHWLTANSRIDLTAQTNTGKAHIFFYDEQGKWIPMSLSAWAINMWGIPTSFVLLHRYTWFQNVWYLVYTC